MSFSTIQQSFFFGLLLIITVVFLWLIRDFIFPIFWAVVLAIIFHPIHDWWLSRTKSRKTISSLLTLLTIIILIFVPLFIVGSLAVSESVNYYQQFAERQASIDAINILEQIGVVTSQIELFGIQDTNFAESLSGYAERFSGWLASQALLFGQNIFRIVLLSLIMLYILFFTLRDGEKLQARLIQILPLGDAKEHRLFKKFVSTTRATIKGTFLIAIIQGFIGGLLFAIVGIGAPFLWGSVIAITSVIPAIGPAIVWFPAGIILLLAGNLWQGILVLGGGALVISLIDNLLRPSLVGKDTEMPELFILLSTLGGLTLFGITGFVIGPIIAAFFLAMWQMFEEEFKRELEIQG